jgi:flagellar M-ring protein FliF
MDFFRRLAQQLREVWGGMSATRRALFVGAAVLVAALLVGVYYFRAQPEWAVLYSHLNQDEAQAIRDRLQSQGVPVRVSYDGSTVEVPADRVGTLRIDLAAQGLPAQAKGYELFDEPSLGSTPTRENINLLRAKQAVIAKTIRQLEPVSNATVEIAKPDPSPFLREKQPTTASVMVQLKPNASLSRSQVGGIVAFVSKAVEGLTPENVTVVDGKGNPLSEPGGPEAGAISSQLDYRKAVESYKSEQAQSLLVTVLGVGRSVVKVTADIDFQHHKETRDEINPEKKALKTERTTSSKTQSTGGGVRGVAGASSNLAGRQPNTALAAGGGGGASTTNQEESESSYEYSHTKIEDGDKFGDIKRLTVAATIDLTPPEGGQPPMTQQAVEGLIKQAVGFDESRGDTIKVEVAKLPGSTSQAPPEPATEEKEEWWRNKEVWATVWKVSLGLAVIVLVLVMALIAFLLVRGTRPAVVVAPQAPVSPERERAAERLASAAHRDPEALARAIAAMMEQ